MMMIRDVRKTAMLLQRLVPPSHLPLPGASPPPPPPPPPPASPASRLTALTGPRLAGNPKVSFPGLSKSCGSGACQCMLLPTEAPVLLACCTLCRPAHEDMAVSDLFSRRFICQRSQCGLQVAAAAMPPTSAPPPRYVPIPGPPSQGSSQATLEGRAVALQVCSLFYSITWFKPQACGTLQYRSCNCAHKTK